MPIDNFPTLNFNPSSIQGKLDPRGAVKTDFGGYTQRGFNSINPVRESFSISYVMLSELDFTTLKSFIKPKLGAVAFNWTHPIDDTEYQMVCEDFSEGIQSGSARYNVSLNLVED